ARRGRRRLRTRSRRPARVPTKKREATRHRVLELRRELTDHGLDAGADTLVWHLARERITVSRATVWRILHKVMPSPHSPTSAPAPPGDASPPTAPTSCGNPTSPTHCSRTAPRSRHWLARRPLEVPHPPVRPPARHRK